MDARLRLLRRDGQNAWSGSVAGLTKANKAQIAKDCRWAIWYRLTLVDERMVAPTTLWHHDKTRLGAPNRRFAIPQADWHLSLGV